MSDFQVGGEFMRAESPDPSFEISMPEALARRYGGNPEDYLEEADRVYEFLADTIESGGFIAATNPEPNEQGLHEVRVIEGASADGRLISKYFYITPEQLAEGIIPNVGIDRLQHGSFGNN